MTRKAEALRETCFKQAAWFIDLFHSLHWFKVGDLFASGLQSPAMANPEQLAILKQGVEAWNR